MVDNLFLVQSPLQALVAVELSLQFEGQTNGVIYLLSGESGRERHNNQICNVIDLGNWSFQERFKLPMEKGINWHIGLRKSISKLTGRFQNNVVNLFFGEFRAQWMHFTRLAIAPERFVLIDDGAATLIAKRRYIDQGIFYPKRLWKTKNPIKNLIKDAIYWGIFEPAQARRVVSVASAFLKNESEFNVDFSSLRQKILKVPTSSVAEIPKAYFFGSKYSESGIISRSYELNFIFNVLNHYQNKGLDLVYCAHRDENEEKLDSIRAMGAVEVVLPDLPAELFILERDNSVAEIGAAYSSVINNLALIFPDKPITSFRLSMQAVNRENRETIEQIYKYYDNKGITIESW